MILKECRDCGDSKPLSDFPPAARRRDGRSGYCRTCMRVRSRASYRKRVEAQGRQVRETPDVPQGNGRCPDCGLVQPVDAFPLNRAARNGRSSYCKPCHDGRGRQSRIRLHGSTREYHLNQRYGITSDDVEAMVEAQGGTCAVCRERAPQHVDHDHLTGVVRGVLCFRCNAGLGQFGDSVDTLTRAIDYLERTTWQRQRVEPGVYRLTSPRRAARPSASSSRPRRPTCSRPG